MPQWLARAIRRTLMWQRIFSKKDGLEGPSQPLLAPSAGKYSHQQASDCTPKEHSKMPAVSAEPSFQRPPSGRGSSTPHAAAQMLQGAPPWVAPPPGQPELFDPFPQATGTLKLKFKSCTRCCKALTRTCLCLQRAFSKSRRAPSHSWASTSPKAQATSPCWSPCCRTATCC